MTRAVARQFPPRGNATRRAVVGGLAASLPVAAALVARALAAGATSRGPDAELIRLGEEYEAALARIEAVLHDLSVREQRAIDAYPPEPADPPMPSGVNDMRNLTLDELASDRHPLAAWSREKHRLQQEWIAEKERVRQQHGVPEAEMEEARASDALQMIVGRILDTPAATLSGLLVKRRLADHEDADAILESIVDDLDALAEGVQAGWAGTGRGAFEESAALA